MIWVAWPEWDVVLPDSVEDEPDVGVDEGNLRVILAAHQDGQVASTVQQLQRCRHLHEIDASTCHGVRYVLHRFASW